MKRTAVLIVLFLLLFAAVSGTALAAGKLTVKSETFVVLPYSDYHAGYVYAELENTGDKPVEYTGGLLELFDEEGNSIDAEGAIPLLSRRVGARGKPDFCTSGRALKKPLTKASSAIIF